VSLYIQLAVSAQDEDIRKVFLDVDKEEKEHVGDFESLLLALDVEQKDELEEGKKEVEKITK
jgi:rubrerythrin